MSVFIFLVILWLTIIVISLILVNGYWRYRREEAQKAAWKVWAQAKGLAFVPSPGYFSVNENSFVKGEVEGGPLVLETFTKREGNRSQTHTRMTLCPQPLPAGEISVNEFPLGQQPSLQEVARLLNPEGLPYGEGELKIEDKGQRWSYEQRGLEAKVYNLQVRLQLLLSLSRTYPNLVALGGEAMTTLCHLAADDDSFLQPIARQALVDIGKDTKRRLKAYLDDYFCPHCFTRCIAHEVQLPWGQPITFYGCRMCGQSRRFFTMPLVAVLDSQMAPEVIEQQAEIQVNWLQRPELFDFERVEIIRATDEAVERFAVKVGNDLDRWRKPRYKQMRCLVSPQAHLSENTLRILERMFGQVTVETPVGQALDHRRRVKQRLGQDQAEVVRIHNEDDDRLEDGSGQA